MTKDIKDEKIELFFPYYVNQERLLDIYAILNGGYSEFSEVTASKSSEKTKKGKADVSFSGFKIFNFGIGASTSGEIGNSTGANEEAKERKVHTVTSVLSMVISELKNKKYIQNIEDSQPGQFVCIDVNLSINSMSSLLSELTDVMKLMESIDRNKTNSNNTKDVEKIAKQMKTLFDGDEIVCEKEKYAVFGTVVDSNLYQAVRSDIIGTELHCLAQVKRVFPTGTELMKNTVFSKLKDKSSKEQMIKAMNNLTEKDVYDFEAVVIPSIENKPVYQLEIIALYQ